MPFVTTASHRSTQHQPRHSPMSSSTSSAPHLKALSLRSTLLHLTPIHPAALVCSIAQHQTASYIRPRSCLSCA